MDSLTVIIIGVVLLLIVDAYLLYRIRKKRQGSFKLVIEKGKITKNIGHVPAEFLYDIQQLTRMNKLENLIINGSGLPGHASRLEFRGNISPELQDKIKHSLSLSQQ